MTSKLLIKYQLQNMTYQFYTIIPGMYRKHTCIQSATSLIKVDSRMFLAKIDITKYG
jgi:hypothetical protein